MIKHYHKIQSLFSLSNSKVIRNLTVTMLLIATGLLTAAQAPNQDIEKDRKMIYEAIEGYNKAWKTRDVGLAVKDYSSYIHWVNSVGDVIRTRKDLEKYLCHIFTLDFVMEAERFPQLDEITFLSEDIGIVHSEHLEGGSKNFHLRVFYKEGDEWKIINHLTSREHPKE